jgi:hypothetical protein
MRLENNNNKRIKKVKIIRIKSDIKIKWNQMLKDKIEKRKSIKKRTQNKKK